MKRLIIVVSASDMIYHVGIKNRLRKSLGVEKRMTHNKTCECKKCRFWNKVLEALVNCGAY